jgi:aryl-alcohol dehydrogenase-like predicted oxidoreductase
MEYRNLGNSGLEVSEIGLGGNNFGFAADEKTSTAVIHHALEMGVNFIDTANMYGGGRSEEIIGKAVRGKRDRVIIATKFGWSHGGGETPNERGGSRFLIMNAVDASLRRLRTDYIDLYQMHKPDPKTPIEETLRALDDLVRVGKVRYIGCCNFSAWELTEALWVSRVNNLHSFISVQSRYNVLERQIEPELVPCCRKYHTGLIPWGPLAAGFLTGKYRHGEELPPDGRLSKKLPTPTYENVLTESNWKKLGPLETFARERDHSVGELAIAWLLAKPWVSTVIAGATKVNQVTANVKAGQWRMPPDEAVQIDRLWESPEDR